MFPYDGCYASPVITRTWSRLGRKGPKAKEAGKGEGEDGGKGQGARGQGQGQGTPGRG